MNYPLFFIAFSLILTDWLVLFLPSKENGIITFIEKLLRLAAYLTLLLWVFLHRLQHNELEIFMISLSIWIFSLSLLLLSKSSAYQILSKIILLIAYFSFGAGLLSHRIPSINLPIIIMLIIIAFTSSRTLLLLYKKTKSTISGTLISSIFLFGICISFFLFITLVTATQGVAWRDRTALFLGLGGTFAYVSEVIFAWDVFIKPMNKGKAWYALFSSASVFCLALGIITKAILITL